MGGWPVGRAFTLVELLVAAMAIAVLSAIALGAATHALGTARRQRASVELDAIAAALETYRLRHGDYPQTSDAAVLLQSLVGRRDPTGASIEERSSLLWASLHVEGNADPVSDIHARLLDPWGRPYVYAWRTSVSWTNPRVVLFSTGPDGIPAAAPTAAGFIPAALVDLSDDLFSKGGQP